MCICVDISTMEYRDAWSLQGHLVAARRDKTFDTDLILLLEHPPVFTLGRQGGLNNLTVSEEFLDKADIPVVRVERGGDITFHGPGQLVVYPIIDLHAARLGIADYIRRLEEVMIRTAAQWSIKAERNRLNRGVWIDGKKLGSVGIAIRRGISFHGMAFNVNPRLEPFGWINPCGLQETEMTSMELELLQEISMKDVRRAVRRHFEAVFGVELAMTGLSELRSHLVRSVRLRYLNRRPTQTL